MNDTKFMILKNLKNPCTIKRLKYVTGIKWSNLSKHLKQLKKEGFLMEVGREGKSKVIQINRYKISRYLEEEIEGYKSMKQELA